MCRAPQHHRASCAIMSWLQVNTALTTQKKSLNAMYAAGEWKGKACITWVFTSLISSAWIKYLFSQQHMITHTDQRRESASCISSVINSPCLALQPTDVLGATKHSIQSRTWTATCNLTVPVDAMTRILLSKTQPAHLQSITNPPAERRTRVEYSDFSKKDPLLL